MIGRDTNADDDQLDDVDAKEVRETVRRALAVDRSDELRIGDLLGNTGDLRPPSTPVDPSTRCEARATSEIERLQRSPHAPEPQLPVNKVGLGGLMRGDRHAGASRGSCGRGEETSGQG